MWSVPASEIHCGDEVPGPGALEKSAQTVHLFIDDRRVMHSSLCGRMPMLHGTGPSQYDPAAVPDGLGYAMRPPSVTWRITA